MSNTLQEANASATNWAGIDLLGCFVGEGIGESFLLSGLVPGPREGIGEATVGLEGAKKRLVLRTVVML